MHVCKSLLKHYNKTMQYSGIAEAFGCTDGYDINGHARVASESDITFGGSDTDERSQSFSTAITLRTSADSARPSDHLIVTPVLIVVFATATNIQYDVDQCRATSEMSVTWTLGKEKSKDGYSIKTYTDIKTMQVCSWRNQAARQALTVPWL